MSNDRKLESRGAGPGRRGPGPGGPGGRDRGWGGRGGGFRPGGRGRRDERGPVGFEAAALTAARGVDKPLLAGDYEAQLEPLETLVLAARKGGKTQSLDRLPEASRGKLFTALLRVMRQRPVEDEEKEAQRRKVFATLAEVWRALGDERRAELATEEAQGAEPAPFLLAHTGEWDKVAALHEREGRHEEAARLYEENGEKAKAASAYQKAGKIDKAFAILAELGERDAILAAAEELPPAKREEALIAAGMGDVLMEMLVKEERWEDVGRLYERADQPLDAARAWERAGKTHKAIRLFDKGGEAAEAERLIEAEIELALAEGGEDAAAQIWARFDRPAKAAAMTSDPLKKSRWLRQAGDVEGAQAVAKEVLEAAQAEGKEPLELAPWLARAGDTAAALRIWDEHRQPEEAAKVLEELAEFELAARCLEVAGQHKKAADLFAKAGNEEAAERLRALIPPEPKAAPRRKPGGRSGGWRRPPQRRG